MSETQFTSGHLVVIARDATGHIITRLVCRLYVKERAR